jgi:cytochrome b subunit of formate dehydrogenase
MSVSLYEEKNLIVRHGVLELTEHWALALSGLVLLLSGLFELPMAARYKITTLPGFAWSGDFITSLTVHYIASVVFIVAAFFHLFYHGLLQDRGLIPRKGDLKASVIVIKSFFGKGEEPPCDKYLPEQRLAYLGMAVIIAVLVLTGLVKTYKNIYAPDLSHTLVFWATWLHNISFVLFILAFAGHIGAILLKPNRPMVRGILTGAVRLDYARQRHPLWLSCQDTAIPAVTPPPVPTVQTVDASALMDTGAAKVGDPTAGGSAESPASPEAEITGTAEVNNKETQEGTNHLPPPGAS